MKNLAIKESWISYSEQVLGHVDTRSVQFTESRRAFFAGAWGVLCEIKNLAELPDGESEAGLEAMFRECREFQAEVLSGSK